MDIRIKETADPQTLTLIDRKTGENWAEDFVFDLGSKATFDEELQTFWMSFGEYVFWSALLKKYQDADDRLFRMLQEVSDAEELNNYVQQHACGNYLDFPAIMHRVMDEWEAEHPC